MVLTIKQNENMCGKTLVAKKNVSKISVLFQHFCS